MSGKYPINIFGEHVSFDVGKVIKNEFKFYLQFALQNKSDIIKQFVEGLFLKYFFFFINNKIIAMSRILIVNFTGHDKIILKVKSNL